MGNLPISNKSLHSSLNTTIEQLLMNKICRTQLAGIEVYGLWPISLVVITHLKHFKGRVLPKYYLSFIQTKFTKATRLYKFDWFSRIVICISCSLRYSNRSLQRLSFEESKNTPLPITPPWRHSWPITPPKSYYGRK